MSLVVRKPAFCICENKDADQLRGNREADQRLCFRYTDSTIPLLPKSEISSHLLWLYSPVCVGPGRKPRRPVFSERGSYVSPTGTSSPSQRKKKAAPGGVIVICLAMQLCIRDPALTDLPLTEHNRDAFLLLFNINKFRGVMRDNKFLFYDNDNRNHHQIKEIIDILKLQVKDFCYRMFAGEQINGKIVETENDIICLFELTGYHITQSQITGKIPKILWRIEF